VVLFNPGRPSVATLCRDLGGVVRAMTALTDSEQAALQARIDTIRDRSGVDFEVAGTAVVLLYREACATVIERWEVDKDVGDALIELFEAYVSYLAAVRQIEPRPQWGSSLSLTAAEQRGAGFTQHETVFDLPRGVLLRSPGVAAAVAELMAR
jgi:hypothetical protein